MKYSFKIAINPYNHAIHGIVIGNARLNLSNAISNNITITDKDIDEGYLNALYSGMLSGRIIVVGDIPPYKPIGKKDIEILTNMQKNRKSYEVKNVDLDEMYEKFLKKIKDLAKEGVK